MEYYPAVKKSKIMKFAGEKKDGLKIYNIIL